MLSQEMSNELNFLDSVGKKVREFLEGLMKSDKEKLQEAKKQLMDGDATEKIVPELAEELGSSRQEVAGFVYYELVEAGLTYLIRHERALHRGYFEIDVGSVMFLMRFGIPSFAHGAESRLKEAGEKLSAADKVAGDFNLGQDAVDFSETQLERISERMEIYEEVIEICKSTKTVYNPTEFKNHLSMIGQGEKEAPERLDDYGTEHILLLRDKIFKERNDAKPYSLDRKATTTNFVNRGQMLPALGSIVDDGKIEKLGELMEKRKSELGDKGKKLDQLTERLDSMSKWDKMVDEKKEIEKFSF